MVHSVACPELPDLVHFDLGILTDAEAEALELHLAGCADCLARLRELRPHDTLVDAMRAQDTVTDQPQIDERVKVLIRTLKELHPAAGATPSPEHTPAPEAYAFLRPAQQPGEMGRLGSYRILRVLGAGGMGVVFEAEDHPLHRRVALKTLRPELAVIASARQRFLREAQTAAAVEHDHLVPIYQVGEDQGVPYLAMQLLQGESLESRLRREGKLPLADVLRIGQEIAEGLSAAHRRGLIHRDIKPANIWLESKDQAAGFRVKILDFGLARLTADESSLTHPGVFVGTPLYGAPEQASGETVDSRCDLFSLGSVLYALCTGEPPFAGKSNVAVLRRVCDDTPRPIREINPEIPDELAALIGRLLAKNPTDRFQSAAAVADELARQRERLHPSAGLSRNGTLATGLPSTARRWALAAAVLLVPLLGLGVTEATGITEVRTLVASLLEKQPTSHQANPGPASPQNAGVGEEPNE